MRTSGNTILLTGGTSGIGYALLQKFLALDNKVIIVGSNAARLSETQQKHPSVQILHADLSDPDAISSLAEACILHHSGINILVNNAGVQYNYTLGENSVDFSSIEKEIRINLISPLQLCVTLLPLLKAKKESAIVNVSSGLAFVPKKSAPVYCGTKAGIHISTKALRYQLENTSVKTFEIIPPLVDTAMTAGRGKGKISPAQLAEEFMKSFAKDQYEINIGKTKLLRLLHRILPRAAEQMLKNG